MIATMLALNKIFDGLGESPFTDLTGSFIHVTL